MGGFDNAGKPFSKNMSAARCVWQQGPGIDWRDVGFKM
jgi:hypothetical protein